MKTGMRPGPRNLITDVEGLRVGNAVDTTVRTGTTVLVADMPLTAGVHVMGGAPGTRETDLLAPDKMVQTVDALVLSGGSAYGLDAAGGVMDGLRAVGRGFPTAGGLRVPIVPAAILFDLANGGGKNWRRNPYHDLGEQALGAAARDFALGTAGAGYGATTADLKGGLGSASAVLGNGLTVGALVAVNALGSVLAAGGPQFWAAPWEFGDEFGGFGLPGRFDPSFAPPPGKRLGEATTIAIVATDAILTQSEATRMAVAAHDGIARAIVPSHTLFDGDLVFAVSSGGRAMPDPASDPFVLGHAAACCLARAIARAVHAARAMPGDPQPTWAARFGDAAGNASSGKRKNSYRD